MLNILYDFSISSFPRLVAPRFVSVPVPELAFFVAIVGCLASGALALGWRLVAKRTRPRVLGALGRWHLLSSRPGRNATGP